MTKDQLKTFVEALEEKRDENRESAKAAALKFTLSNDGVAQRKALVDNSTSETYAAVLNYLAVEFGVETKENANTST